MNYTIMLVAVTVALLFVCVNANDDIDSLGMPVSLTISIFNLLH